VRVFNIFIMVKTIIPVILCGGQGTRLWPLSSHQKPKQFMNFPGSNYSLLQNTMMRLKNLDHFEKPILVTHQSFLKYLETQCQECEIDINAIIAESEYNGTSFAGAVAAFLVKKIYNEDALILILPTDHYIEDHDNFFSDIYQAALEQNDRHMTIFGIKPNKIDSNYGYITVEKDPSFIKQQKVKKFIEKPRELKIKEMMQDGLCYWNSGIFLCSAHFFLSEMKIFAPEIYKQSKLSMDKAYDKELKIFLPPISLQDKRSIDQSIIEQSNSVYMRLLNIDWRDLGNFHSAWEVSEKDTYGNFSFGDVFLMDTQDSYIVSEQKPATVIGLQNILVVNTEEAILIADKSNSNSAISKMYHKFKDIKESKSITNKLINKVCIQNGEEAHQYRPWGHFYFIENTANYAVKKLTICHSHRTSLQFHHNRCEYIIVLSGIGSIVIDDKEIELKPGVTTKIMQKQKHRIINSGNSDLVIIEVQTGLISEEDIVRLEDDYNRV
jgi:mannose-1-phosphate guanylyltransferase/mannose-6-phosphate isomerase